MAKEREGSKQWFKFYSARWYGSDTITGMTSAERGVLVQMMVAYDLFGPLPKDAWKLSKVLRADYRTTVRWLSKYSDMTDTCQSDDTKLTLPKFDVLQEIMQKTSADKQGEENRREIERKKEEKSSLSSSQKQERWESESNVGVSPAQSESSPASGSSLLDWDEPVGEFSVADIRRAILYVSKYSANTWYRGKLSPAFIRKNARKLIDEVPIGWNPPAATKKRIIDPNCEKCHGRGGKSVRIPNTLAHLWQDCACVRVE